MPGLVSLLYDKSTFVGYFNEIHIEEQLWYYLTNSCGVDKRVHAFLKSISPKVNVSAWLKFELAYLQASPAG